MLVIDIEEAFGLPNAALQVEVKPTTKRPSGKTEDVDVTGAMIKYALEKALEQITCKEP